MTDVAQYPQSKAMAITCELLHALHATGKSKLAILTMANVQDEPHMRSKRHHFMSQSCFEKYWRSDIGLLDQVKITNKMNEVQPNQHG